jgi:hypothetical protein
MKTLIGIAIGMTLSAVIVAGHEFVQPKPDDPTTYVALDSGNYAVLQSTDIEGEKDTIVLAIGLEQPKCEEMADKMGRDFAGVAKVGCVPVPSEPSVGWPSYVTL